VERERNGFYWAGEGFLIEDLFHPRGGKGPIYADGHLVVTRTHNPSGLRFAGEIDISNSDAVAHSMRLVFGDLPNPHLDLSNLSFCDISGIRALLAAASELGDGRKLLLHGLPEQLQTVMRVTGWSDLTCVELCKCGGSA
jgi:anti-anti-sigma factor